MLILRNKRKRKTYRVGQKFVSAPINSRREILAAIRLIFFYKLLEHFPFAFFAQQRSRVLRTSQKAGLNSGCRILRDVYVNIILDTVSMMR